MTTERESFLARWARRKRETAAPAAPAEDPAPAPEEPSADARVASADTAPPSAEAGAPPELPLPSLDDVTPGGDLSAFMAAHVPDGLRNAALQRMWRLDPLIRDFENPAREYAYNWNLPGGAPSFGPLPDGFDAENMLRRITGRGAPPEADGEAEPARVAGGSTAEPTEAVATPETAAVAEAEPPDAGAPAVGGPPVVARPVVAPPGEEPEARPREAAPAAPAPSTPPRPRRHGGALPS